MRRVRKYILERRSSFVFTVGSMLFGCYHFLKPSVLGNSGAYEALNFILGILSGRYFGLAFIVISLVKLYGIIKDNKQLRLSAYFALVFLWSLLAVGFFISFLQGNDNTAWITLPMIVGLSANIVSPKSITIRRRMDE